ncbi:GNAT family N-acetyltransferase [bacterium]|nr:GNAT family N-acetyltransferase [bacterium]
MKYFKKVERGKIYLSPVNPDDYETIAQWMNDPKVTKELALHTRIASLEKEKNRLENIVKNGDYIFAIVKQENDEFIGTIGIHDIDALNQHAEIGISI